MHTSFLSAVVASLLVLSATAAPAPAPISSSQSTTVQSAHQLPGSPHAPNLHPATSSSSSTSESPSPIPPNLTIRRRDASNLNAEEMKDLIMEIKREDWLSSLQNQKTGSNAKGGDGGNGGNGDDEDHATYMLGSPVSFPARGGQGGRSVA